MPENGNGHGSIYPSGRLGDWARFISIVGIAGAIALYLVYFLASTMNARMTDNTAALLNMANAVMTLAGKADHHEDTTVEVLDAEKAQTNATKVLVRVTVQSCLNQAGTNKLQIDRCWSSIDREPMYPGGTTASNPKALPKQPPPEPFSQGKPNTLEAGTPAETSASDR
jgi:hypothetical protein